MVEETMRRSRAIAASQITLPAAGADPEYSQAMVVHLQVPFPADGVGA